MNIECLNPAYEKIKSSEIYEKIVNKEELFHQIFLYQSPYIESSDGMFDSVRNFYFGKNRGISERSKVFEDIIKLERDIEDKNYFSPIDFEKTLLNHPCFLSYFILREEIFDYKEFGFSSLKILSESITSFCIGERSFGNSYSWRTNNFKNEIMQNIHGDLYASQSDVSGNVFIEKTLFGEKEKFETFKEDYPKGISAYQEWSQFLVATLKYAEYIGKDKADEIINWKEVLEKLGGGVGTATSEAMFGTNFSEYDLNYLMDHPIFQDEIKLEQYPLSLYSQSKTSFYPYFSEGKLFYLEKDETGDILMENLSHVYKDKKFSKVLEYSKEDLPHILTATYKYFARDRSKMYKIMDYFNSER